MKAAIIKAAESNPVYGDFREPVAQSGQTIVTMRASALSRFTKSRASGSHYSSDGDFPAKLTAVEDREQQQRDREHDQQHLGRAARDEIGHARDQLIQTLLSCI